MPELPEAETIKSVDKNRKIYAKNAKRSDERHAALSEIQRDRGHGKRKRGDCLRCKNLEALSSRKAPQRLFFVSLTGRFAQFTNSLFSGINPKKARRNLRHSIASTLPFPLKSANASCSSVRGISSKNARLMIMQSEASSTPF